MLKQILRKLGERRSDDRPFAGYHCQDCILWERVNGKGRCLVTGNARWPGDDVCDDFAQ